MATRRLQKEARALAKNPLQNPTIIAVPNESNILEWHYVLEGGRGTPYEGGHYHGKIIFPKEYPLKPPSVVMLTPSGRFKPNRRLCLSMSDFHPETWNPMWSVSTILTGLYSFMIERAPTLGSIETTDAMKRKLGRQSLMYNVKDAEFCRMFPQLVELYKERQKALAASDALSSERSAIRTSSANGHGGNAMVRGLGWNAVDNGGLIAMATAAVAILSLFFALRWV